VTEGGLTRRYLEVDVLKATGIVAVVLIHSLRNYWDPSISPLELWLSKTTRFAVPAFLACSGFLYASTARVPCAATLRRLRRILIPYLIVSIAAQIWHFAHGQGPLSGSLLRDFLFGSSFGPYYYVFVIFCLVLVTPLIAMLPRFALVTLLALLIFAQGFLESGSGPSMTFFWSLRNPLLWWGYFVLGWVVRLNYDPLNRWIAARRLGSAAVLVLAVVICVGIANSEGPRLVVRSAAWLNIHAILALLFVLTCGRPGSPAPVRILGDATYAIYLLHLFFVYAVLGYVTPAYREFDLAALALPWAAGLVGALAVVGVMRALLGPRARDVIGA
jgi:peptidoglycan/LPS O-acetylase OafA/YrhL